MAQEIIHCDGKFVIWSSACDAPATQTMTEEELREYLHREECLLPYQVASYPSFGPLATADMEKDFQASREKIERRIARAKRNGASGLRWYDEEYTGEWHRDLDTTLTPAEIVALSDRTPPTN